MPDIRFSVTKCGNAQAGTFFFLVDEVRYAVMEEYTEAKELQWASATINIELRAGQTVRIENGVSTAIWGTNGHGILYSWFTGHLLYAL